MIHIWMIIIVLVCLAFAPPVGLILAAIYVIGLFKGWWDT